MWVLSVGWRVYFSAGDSASQDYVAIVGAGRPVPKAPWAGSSRDGQTVSETVTINSQKPGALQPASWRGVLTPHLGKL